MTTSLDAHTHQYSHVNGSINDMLERFAVSELCKGWPVYRDSSEWKNYRNLFAKDATVWTTWSKGRSVDDFIAISKQGKDKGDFIMHRECGTLVDYSAEYGRAIGKMKATITQRFKTPQSLATKDCPTGTEFDVDCDCRFIFFCFKDPESGGDWKARYVKLFYEKDKIVPVDGIHAPKFSVELLESFPEGYSHLGAAQSTLGYPVTKHLPTARDHNSWFGMYSKMEQWLAGQHVDLLVDDDDAVSMPDKRLHTISTYNKVGESMAFKKDVHANLPLEGGLNNDDSFFLLPIAQFLVLAGHDKMSTVVDTAQAAFDSAIRDFKSKLNDPRVFNEILQTTSIDQVYDATDKLQEEQSKKGHLRNLARIAPYLTRLNDYAASIEVFVQVKPEILALIWGPIKLLLQWASAVKTSFDAIVTVTEDIGILLPEFKKSAQMFHENKQINHVLALFFKDILDFYVIALKFFKQSGALKSAFDRKFHSLIFQSIALGFKHLFEALWPKQRDKIKVVMEAVQSHTRLMRNEVQFEHIQREHEARLRQLEESEARKRAEIRQDFDHIKTDLAPKSFDEAFYRSSGQVCQGTGKWLLQDEKFLGWTNILDKSINVIWLQGIPGAGKTFLSTTVINEIRKFAQVAFAILSHTSRNSTTAISVIHSFIFQIVSHDESRQAVVCNATGESLKMDIAHVTKLLTTVLGCAGPSYIILDGLDEIEEQERGRLLDELLKISKACEDVKIFISSRPESDIAAKLSQDVTIMRVDHRNFESIETFVTQWTEHWFEDREFFADDRREIQARLAPLASKAKEFIGDSLEIQRELEILPESLDAAYRRILDRINGSQNPVRKEMAQKIIGWVASAPTPLTIQELQRALTIKDGDRGGNLRVLGNLPLVRLCGPIVEVAGDYVQFVHFTTKEYLTSPRIPGFVGTTEATLGLAVSCITYLCQQHHDLATTDEEIRNNLRNGLYVLHDFSTTMWPKLVKSCLDAYGSRGLPDRLIKALESLMATRKNNQYKDESDSNESLLSGTLDVIPSADIRAFLTQAHRFRRVCGASEHRIDGSTSWVDLDPTLHSRLAVKIDRAIGTLLQVNETDPVDHLKWIKHWYGAQPFKCRFLHCPRRRDGFAEVSERKYHERNHDRPWKCSFPGCSYAEGGFLSRNMRDYHLDRFHQEQETIDIGISITDSEERIPLLFDLVKFDQIDAVKALLALPEWDLEDSIPLETAIELCKNAAFSGSPPMVDALVSVLLEPKRYGSSNFERSILFFTGRQKLLESSILGENMDMVGFVLGRFEGLSVLCEAFFCSVVRSDRREFYDMWERRVATIIHSMWSDQTLEGSQYF
ncbi:putative NACHT domain-containing protein [Seiridium cardinale]|uniref:NACHT domain-containing protein n=1 Tax=Seiridium cardinale TaxID=138064 RepID=A0ABR2XKM2_9PEZI